MHTDTNHAPGRESAAALRGILSLLVAEREERQGGGSRRAEQILARAGLSAEQIAAITGYDASRVRTIIENDTTVARPAREQSIIDRARAVLTRQSPTSERPER
jgi:hypothetical protein